MIEPQEHPGKGRESNLVFLSTSMQGHESINHLCLENPIIAGWAGGERSLNTNKRTEPAVSLIVVSHQADRHALKQNAQRAGDTRPAAHHPN